MKLHFDVASDLYVAGRTEDGRDYTAEIYMVIAEDQRGNRWVHRDMFQGCEAGHDDEGWPYFADIRGTAQAAAETLRARIVAAGGAVDLGQYWTATRPAYGSRAYIEYGQYDDWIEEQEENQRGGW